MQLPRGQKITWHEPLSNVTPGTIIDLNGATIYAAPDFQGDAFFHRADWSNIKIINTAPTQATLRGKGIIAGFRDTVTTERCLIAGITFNNCVESYLIGGNRLTQTGGRNIVTACRFITSPLAFAGVGHMLLGNTWQDCSEHAMRGGIPPLDWGDVNRLGFNDIFGYKNTIRRAWTSVSDDYDYGCLYMGRDLTSDCLFIGTVFDECRARALYLDDGFSGAVFTATRFVDCYKDFWIGGGITGRLEAKSTKQIALSRLDNRLAVGAVGFNIHKEFHSQSWQHGTVQGPAGTGKFQALDKAIRAAGAEPWLARANVHCKYEEVWAKENEVRCGFEVSYDTDGAYGYEVEGFSPHHD